MFPPEKESAAEEEEELEQSVDGGRAFDDASVFATPSVTSSALARRTKQARSNSLNSSAWLLLKPAIKSRQ